jgi:peptide deformylase
MSVRPITILGNKILRKKSKAITGVDIEIIELIKDMFDTMKNANGIGLAANQVGVDKSLFVLDISGVEDYEDIKPMVLINPEIIERSEEQVSLEEGCLSIPEVRSEVKRPVEVKIKYRDADFKEHTIKASELLARVIQHEYDHLQGILFTDYLSSEELKKLNKALQKIKDGDYETDYPVLELRDKLKK